MSAIAVVAAALCALSVSAAAQRSHKCGHVPGAYSIRAFNISCEEARSVARRARPLARPIPRCPRHWAYGISQRTGRITCSRPPKLVTFYLTPRN